MRVLLDLRWMKPGYTGGIEIHARAFLNTLCNLDFSNQYHILLPNEVRYDFDLRYHNNIYLYSTDSPEVYARQLLQKAAQFLWVSKESIRNNMIQKAASQVDISFALPGYISPPFRSLPTVLNVPDIQHEYFPNFFSPDELQRRRNSYSESIRSAVHLTTITGFTRSTLIERLNVPPEKITTAYIAADSSFQQSYTPDQVKKNCKKYNLPWKEYLYYPAATWPHKNHRSVILALHRLIHETGQNLILVCSGPKKEAQPEIENLVRELNLGEHVRFLGYVNRNEIPLLYHGAAALVFLSLFEGFGMPVLEAMHCGCPVVCSNTTCLPEIAGDAAILVDPLDIDLIAEKIGTVINDSTLRESLVLKGYSQAKKFSWVTHTTQIVEILRRIADNQG